MLMDSIHNDRQREMAKEVNQLAKSFKETGDENYLKRLIPLLELRLRKVLNNHSVFKKEEEGGLTLLEKEEYINLLMTVVLTKVLNRYDPNRSTFLTLFWTAIRNRIASDLFSKPSPYNIVGSKLEEKYNKRKRVGIIRRPQFPPRSIEWILESANDEDASEGDFPCNMPSPRDVLEDRDSIVRLVKGLTLTHKKTVMRIIQGFNVYQAMRRSGIRSAKSRKHFYEVMRRRLYNK
jgi:hypothetical protein